MSNPDPGLYARSFADVYDTWYGDLDDPAQLVAAFAQRCTEGAQIYELGGGTGRLAGPLTQAGFAVISVDISQPMLRDMPTGPLALTADMAALALQSATADAVLIAYNTLFNLAGLSLQQQCFAESARVLRPGGLLAIEAFIAPAADDTSYGMSSRRHPTDPASELAIVTGPDPADPDAIIGSHIEVGATTTCRPWRLVYQSPEQLDACAELANLVLVERNEDWHGTPLAHDSSRHVSWYRARSVS